MFLWLFLFMADKDFLMAIRQAILMALDAIERKCGVSPRTSEIREWHRRSHNKQAEQVDEETH